jgi:hypothetical protein
MNTPKQPPKVHMTPLRGELKVADVRRAVKQVKAEREAGERARPRVRAAA